jgi:hypothetical protein
MATERHAHLARTRHSAYLRSLGAHAIAVDQVREKGRRTYGVVAFFDKRPRAVPHTLSIKTGHKTVAVPLVARKAPRFKLE